MRDTTPTPRSSWRATEIALDVQWALSGLGTPNAASLLATLSGVSIAPAAPVVTSAAISGQAGKALSFTASATDRIRSHGPWPVRRRACRSALLESSPGQVR